MEEWTVLTVLIVLAGFLATLIKPVISLNSTIIRLTDAVKVLEKNLESMAGKNNESHARLWQKTQEQGDMLLEHEMRLARIEE